MSEAIEHTACTKCENTEGPHYRVADNERLCPDCLAAEYERSLAVASAYVDYLKRKVEAIRAMKDMPCPRCGGTGLVVVDGGASGRCPTCKPNTAYFGPGLGVQPIVGDGNEPLGEWEDADFGDDAGGHNP